MEKEKFEFYKNKDSDVIYWVDNTEQIGEHLFTFDKKKIYNLFADYPHNLTVTGTEGTFAVLIVVS